MYNIDKLLQRAPKVYIEVDNGIYVKTTKKSIKNIAKLIYAKGVFEKTWSWRIEKAIPEGEFLYFDKIEYLERDKGGSIKKILYWIGKHQGLKLFRKLYHKYNHGYYPWGLFCFIVDFGKEVKDGATLGRLDYIKKNTGGGPLENRS